MLLSVVILTLPDDVRVLRGLLLLGLLVTFYWRLVHAVGEDEKQVRREGWGASSIEYLGWKNGEDV